MKRKLISRLNVKERAREVISQVDNVDRSGFIPLDIQFQRMQTAGEELATYRYYQYNTDMALLDKIEAMNVNDASEELADATSKANNRTRDKVVLDDMLKEKLNKYRRFKNKQDELKALKEKYDQSVKEREIYDRAINDYKEQEYRRRLEESGR